MKQYKAWDLLPEEKVYLKSEVDEAIAELKDVIHELRVDLEHVKNGDCINTCDVLEKYGKELRQTRRALWLARALRARDIQRWWIAVTCAPITERACRVWNNIEIKCLKKAEEYK